jgi:hypothetical protein
MYIDFTVMRIVWIRQSAYTSTMIHQFRVHYLFPPTSKERPGDVDAFGYEALSIVK